ncbi:MAG: 50S ribosomal protein L10 [Anaerolineae bacterium]|nr:50S ribosomal protein L10 [Anaerolineae bacterium]
MALTRTEKEQVVQGYSEKLNQSQVVIWASFTGLTVAESTRLRRQLDQADAEMMVVKNSLMGIALEQAGLPMDDAFRDEANLVAFIRGDIASATKALVDFASSTRDLVKIKGGLVGGSLATSEQVRSLTTLPTREVLLAQVLGGIQAPISSLVSVLAGTVRGVMNVLNARVEQLEGPAS